MRLVEFAQPREHIGIQLVAHERQVYPSGGIAGGHALVASMAFGAEGINMGNRFVATKEAAVHQNVKDAVVDAGELATRLIMHPRRNTERRLSNAALEWIVEMERNKGSAPDARWLARPPRHRRQL